jgi:hypothetical protein
VGLDDPPGVDTWTGTAVFAGPAGVTARISVSLTTVNDAAGAPPIETA